MHENALQFVNNTALQNLHTFILTPSRIYLRLLILAPALYAVADFEFNGKDARIDSATLAVFRWIYIRAFVVLQQLTARWSSPSVKISPQADDWQKVLRFHRSQFF